MPDDGDDDDDRHTLADRQRQLLESLTTDQPAPPEFDPRRIELARRSLLAKRARGVAKAWPSVAADLAGRFDELVERYARSHELPQARTGDDDGLRFARWLCREGLLSDDGRIQLLVRRAARGWPLRMTRLPGSHRLAIALRLPARGIRWFSIRFG
ncbi:MAG TPA: hypothetical protein VH475_00475 [Tepidisphaeraceae bacterium]|jgi:hypothetical protein